MASQMKSHGNRRSAAIEARQYIVDSYLRGVMIGREIMHRVASRYPLFEKEKKADEITTTITQEESDRHLRQELKLTIEEPWLASIKRMEAQYEQNKLDPKYTQERLDQMKAIIEHSKFYCNVIVQTNDEFFKDKI
jgi:tRNA-dihydrouridine synthase